MPTEIFRIFRAGVWYSAMLLLALNLPACNWFPAVDLAPTYEPAEFVVPASWHGSSPFVEAKPSDGELRPDWWTIYNDPTLNKLEEQAMAANPDLQERGCSPMSIPSAVLATTSWVRNVLAGWKRPHRASRNRRSSSLPRNMPLPPDTSMAQSTMLQAVSTA